MTKKLNNKFDNIFINVNCDNRCGSLCYKHYFGGNLNWAKMKSITKGSYDAWTCKRIQRNGIFHAIIPETVCRPLISPILVDSVMEEIGIFQYFAKNAYNIDHREDRNIFGDDFSQCSALLLFSLVSSSTVRIIFVFCFL